MHMPLKRPLALLVVLAFFIVPLHALAYGDAEDSQVKAGAMTADVLLARPLGLAGTVLGFGLFVISSPFSALGGNIGEAWDALVAKPAVFTFKRPLGEFD